MIQWYTSLSAMKTDTDLNGRSPYTRFIQRYVNRSKMTFEAIWNKHTMGFHVRGPLFPAACVEQPSSAPPKF